MLGARRSVHDLFCFILLIYHSSQITLQSRPNPKTSGAMQTVEETKEEERKTDKEEDEDLITIGWEAMGRPREWEGEELRGRICLQTI